MKSLNKTLLALSAIAVGVVFLTSIAPAQQAPAQQPTPSLSSPLIVPTPPRVQGKLYHVPGQLFPINSATGMIQFPPEIQARMDRDNQSAVLSSQADFEAAKGGWTKAIPLYQQALDLEPRNAMALYGLGDYSLTKNDTQAAIGYYRQAIYDYAAPPTTPRFQEINAYRLMEYAILLSQTGQQDEAIAVYQHGAQLLNYMDGHPRPKPMLPDFGAEPGQIAYTPQRLQALADVGWANDHVDFDREGAKARLQQAVALYPDSPLPYFYRARYEANYGHDRSAAAADFAKVDQLGSGATLEFVDHDRHFYHMDTAAQKPPVAQKRSATP